MFSLKATAGIVFALCLAACGQAQERASAPISQANETNAAVASLLKEASAVWTASAPNAVMSHTLPDDRPFVVTADLSFRTADVRQTAVAIEQLALAQGGFVVSNQTRSEVIRQERFKQTAGKIMSIEHYVSYSDLTVRIPRDRTTSFLHALQPHITLLEQQTYAAEDVLAIQRHHVLTKQREQKYILGLENIDKQEQEKALQSEQASAASGTMSKQEQILARRQAAQQREHKAQVQQLELQDKIDYATISLHFRQPETVFQSIQPDSEALAAALRPTLGASLQQAFIDSRKFLTQCLLFIVHTWFVWLIAVGIWIVRRKRKHKHTD